MFFVASSVALKVSPIGGVISVAFTLSYNVTLKPPDEKAASIVAASEPFSYCECLIYDWDFKRWGRSTKVTVNVYFKANAKRSRSWILPETLKEVFIRTFLLLPIWEALQRSLIEGIMDAFAEEVVNREAVREDELDNKNGDT
ncbi:kelch-like [Perkinsus olseni]|uniref:Kelch-like n=1 Tax=Perkinsus olseni TaxID=32597 RepID=A0A7J6NV69_PEROL|nr:kelch-like [Perkinsus olseni]